MHPGVCVPLLDPIVCGWFHHGCVSDAIILNNSSENFSTRFFMDSICVFKSNGPPESPISNGPIFYRNSSSVANSVCPSSCLLGSPLEMSTCTQPPPSFFFYCLPLPILSGVVPSVPVKKHFSARPPASPTFPKPRVAFTHLQRHMAQLIALCFLRPFLVLTPISPSSFPP